MTTILADRGRMVSDGQAGLDGVIVETKAKKISSSVNLHGKRFIVGVSGNGAILPQLVKKIEQCNDILLLEGFGTRWSALILFEGICYYGDPEGFTTQELPMAIGSGGFMALAAYLASGSMLKSMSIAIQLDPHSGGEVRDEDIWS